VAAEDAAIAVRQRLGGNRLLPEVEIVGKIKPFLFVPDYLHAIAFELIMNSFEATIEKHEGSPLPPVRVILADSDLEASFKFSDCGGGMRRSVAERAVWTHLYASTKVRVPRPVPPLSPVIKTNFAAANAAGETSDEEEPGSGGVALGLAVCRLSARYFKGDLKLYTMTGYGTDAYLYFPKH
jgi:pyruvate dehydrogenase kinase 2/3/4